MKKNKHKEIFKIIKKFLIKNDSFFFYFFIGTMGICTLVVR